MAFPVVQTYSEGRIGDITSASLDLPTGISVGDRLIFIVTSEGEVTLSTASSGWVKVGQVGASFRPTQAIFTKVATGSDAFSVSQSSVRTIYYVGLRISGAGAVSGTGAAGTSAPNDSPSHTPSGGAQDYLWLTTYGAAGLASPSPPTGYTQITFLSGGASTSPSTGVARKNLNAATENPAEWTAGGQSWAAWTLAVAPTAGAADTTAPTITSASSGSTVAGTAFSLALTANETVTWSIVGGANQAKFSVSSSTLTMSAANATPAGTYVVVVRATDLAGNTSDQTITVTVTAAAASGGPLTARVLRVGAGGGGGAGYVGGGAGAGEFLENPAETIAEGSYPVVVGAGGTVGSGNGGKGGSTSFNGVSMNGGGYGGAINSAGGPGGSGGGGGYGGALGSSVKTGAGLGNNGTATAGGGGGAGGAAGAATPYSKGGNGGLGVSSDISGTAVSYAGGGGGGGDATGGTGGSGAGGAGGAGNNAQGLAAPANRGGGGGGAGGGSVGTPGGLGGSGVVIIRYAGAPRATGGTITTVGSDTVHTFTSNGTFVVLAASTRRTRRPFQWH